jgi:hypothetical protein
MRGIKFKMKDGTFDYYDPLEQEDFQETSDAYTLDMNYLYEIPKQDVEYYEWFDLCDDCGYELEYGSCGKCAEDKELNDLKNP